MNLTYDKHIGEIVDRYPLATRVLSRYGIDACCGRSRPLGEVCAENDLSAAAVLKEIQGTLTDGEPTGRRWDEAPVLDLLQHIVDHYHEPLRAELPRLEAMARQVARHHGKRDPERFTELLHTFVRLRRDLEFHLDREEHGLFPEILDEVRMTDIILTSFEEEHSRMARSLARLRELTDGYLEPEDASGTWRALWRGLKALEDSQHRHIHLENHVLFPRLRAA